MVPSLLYFMMQIRREAEFEKNRYKKINMIENAAEVFMLRKTLLLILLVLMNHSFVVAQWVQTNGPYSCIIRCFAVIGMNFFSEPWDGGIFLSTNNGVSWTQINTGSFCLRHDSLCWDL